MDQCYRKVKNSFTHFSLETDKTFSRVRDTCIQLQDFLLHSFQFLGKTFILEWSWFQDITRHSGFLPWFLAMFQLFPLPWELPVMQQQLNTPSELSNLNCPLWCYWQLPPIFKYYTLLGMPRWSHCLARKQKFLIVIRFTLVVHPLQGSTLWHLSHLGSKLCACRFDPVTFHPAVSIGNTKPAPTKTYKITYRNLHKSDANGLNQ